MHSRKTQFSSGPKFLSILAFLQEIAHLHSSLLSKNDLMFNSGFTELIYAKKKDETEAQ